MRTRMHVAAAGAVGAVAVSLGVVHGETADEPMQAPVAAQRATEPSAPPATLDPAAIAGMMAANGGGHDKDELPKFEDVSKDYVKVVSSADDKRSLYTLWTREKDAQILAELPPNFASQKLFIAFTVAGGTTTSGVQSGDMYAYWKRFDKRLALVEPNYAVRTTGDLESKKGRERVFTDRVILDIPIEAMGPGGGPVIDVDALLLGKNQQVLRYPGANANLARIAKAKAFPENIEVAFELPLTAGRLGTLAFSVRVLPENTGYTPREADARIGYFTTTYKDVGHPGKDTPWVRYVNRWKLEKADPKLKMSPPKQPIVFYLEHTVPVRYRRWVRDGVLEWNKAFEQVGIVNAIEVYQQDARTGAHMEKDPEDARYNFVLWTNAGMGFAIGPSRVDPRTGQIIDADIVMDEGFITSWVNAWKRTVPETAMLNFGPETLAWLQTRPQWDPRVRLAPPEERADRERELMRQQWSPHAAPFSGHPAGAADPSLLGDQPFDGLAGRLSQENGYCDYAMAASLELALFRLAPDLITDLAQNGAKSRKAKKKEKKEDDEAQAGDEGDADDESADDDEGEDDAKSADADDADDDEDADSGEGETPKDEQTLDGVPEWFIGPLLKGVIMHEVGHTLGLRHNFKASCAFSLEEINSRGHEGLPITGSVMDYTPINVNFGDGEVQGEYAMMTLGPYDKWAIQYGYTLEQNLKPILSRVSEPELIFGTDEDSWGSDPRARVFDLGSDPLAYAESQMRLVKELRTEILDRMVDEGDSWAKARQAYELLLGRHFNAVSIAANWVGGDYVNRDRKGDPGDRDAVAVAPLDQQRRALAFVIENTFDDDAFGLTAELLAKMSVDKWWDEGGFSSIFQDPAWPIHDRIMAIQASALTMMLNPTTLNRVYDNEFRTSDSEDALTLPEVVWGVTDAVWSELDTNATGTFTTRQPMISSLRRNLQREELDRLIDLSLPNARFGVAEKPVSNLCVHKLRELDKKIAALIERRGSKLDAYTLAHLSEAQVRIETALDAQYIYNRDDLRGGGGGMIIIMGQEEAEQVR